MKIEIPNDIHRRLKAAAAISGQSLGEYIAAILREYIAKAGTDILNPL